ncbi:uncharacterized protein LOC129796648 [Lutzomyia longipalpis]|uniref:uncharacterized protein LOC129796648 n=1 Tax=Lutzomyia longipalpis TaxID=7200 RepID=UPI002484253E|nr:uncharacterized protein LOC129796648 [Lutzomyia longipalpis]
MAASLQDILSSVEEIVEQEVRESIGRAINATTRTVIQRVRAELDPESSVIDGDELFGNSLRRSDGQFRNSTVDPRNTTSFRAAVSRLNREDTPLIDLAGEPRPTPPEAWRDWVFEDWPNGNTGRVPERNEPSGAPRRSSAHPVNFEERDGRHRNEQRPTSGVLNSSPRLRLAQFDGTTPIEEYLTQFHLVANIHNWNSSERAAALASELRGTALNILSGLTTEQLNDCFLLENALRRRFGRSEHKDLCVVEFQSRVQRAKEHLMDFATDLRRLANIAYADCPPYARERLLVLQFRVGVCDMETRQELRRLEPRNLDAAVHRALLYEAEKRLETNRARSVREVAAIDESDSSDTQKNVNTVTSSNQGQRKRQFKGNWRRNNQRWGEERRTQDRRNVREEGGTTSTDLSPQLEPPNATISGTTQEPARQPRASGNNSQEVSASGNSGAPSQRS